MSDIAVLTARPDLPIYREVEVAAAARGHRAVVWNALELVARADRAEVFSGAQRLALDGVVAVLPRVGNWRPDSVLAVLLALTSAGVPSLNPIEAIRRGRDHWRTACALAAGGLPHPETVAGSEPEAVAATAAEVCGFPCVVKQRRSRQGTGVIKVSSRAELEAVLDSLWRVGDEVVVQRFCPPGGVSWRVLVLHGEVLGATEHRAAAGEFRANAARGGSVAAVSPDREQCELAVAAAAVTGLSFAGVDLLPDGDRVVVGEVNPTPGWKHFREATGVDVAAHLVAGLLRLGGVR
jgi:ribosomal protein S6--L-glutamate ligase